MNLASDGKPSAARVFVVDDDRRILAAISRLLGAAGFDVQTFETAKEFLERHDPNIPGCALLDVGLEDLDGLALQKVLTANNGMRPVIFLTGCDDVHTSVRAMKAGAVDYLTKPVQDTTLIAAVQSAIENDRIARDERQITDNLRARYERLTPREREVMEHVVAGRLNKQIAFDLGTVEKTIKVHRAHIMEKMQVHSVAALVHIAGRLAAADAKAAR
jgi:FixJ family two-component response regulator